VSGRWSGRTFWNAEPAFSHLHWRKRRIIYRLDVKIHASCFLSAFRSAESAREKDDKAYQQHQAKPAAADDGATEVKPAAAKQKKQNNYD
jgi:hypothetical protein